MRDGVFLTAGRARVGIDAAAGGRLASLEVDGLELLVTEGSGEGARRTAWGSYPLVPWAGRVRNGRFRFAGREYQLPLNWPPHAIHGTTFDRTWHVVESGARRARLEIDLGDAWPFPGRAVQTFALSEDGLDWTLSVHAEAEAFPACVGWHPWWRRRIGRGDEARLEFRADWMYRRDSTGIAIAERVRPSPRPWDDCFTGVTAPPVLVWDGALRLELHSDADHWVVYDEPVHAICVEPMTGPPDALNIAPRLVEPGRPLSLSVRLAWQRA